MARVLVVDDESGVCRALEVFLTGQGHEVATVESGEESLRMLRAFRPQIVLLDIRMPGMDGLEVLRKIVKREPETRVIMLTAVHEAEVAKTALGEGAVEYLTKPVDLDYLKTVVNVYEIDAAG